MTYTAPELARAKPDSAFSSVLLPEPEPPTIATNSRGRMISDTSLRIVRPAPTVRTRSRASRVIAPRWSKGSSELPSYASLNGPIWISVPGCSSRGTVTRCPPTKVPLVLPRSRSTCPPPGSVPTSACARDTSGLASVMFVPSRPIVVTFGSSGILVIGVAAGIIVDCALRWYSSVTKLPVSGSPMRITSLCFSVWVPTRWPPNMIPHAPPRSTIRYSPPNGSMRA